jgi:hypothetical protein
VKYRGLSAVLLWIALELSVAVAWGQQYTRQEVGAGVQAQTSALFEDLAPSSIPDSIGPEHLFSGPFGRYTWNLSPSLAIEGRVGYLPGFQTSYSVDNGHELMALGGVKAGWRGRRFGFFGTMEPGIASFSPGLNVNVFPGKRANYQRRTNFALDFGGAGEWYPTPRTIVRFDVTQTLIAEYDQVLSRAPGYFALHEGHLAQHLGLAFSVAHRFGNLREETESEPARMPFDVGILYSLQQRQHLSLAQMQANSGGGAWISWNFSRYLSFDAAAFYDPVKDGFIFPQDGGTTTDVFTGFKAGIRREHLGYFAKVRPGIMQFSRTNWLDNAGKAYWEKTTDFAIDAGGVIEVYPSRHTILRAEAGNAFIHYHAADIHIEPDSNEYDLPRRRASILMLFGAGFRF